MRGTYSKVVSVKPSTLVHQCGCCLIFWEISVFPWLRTLYCIVTFLITIIAGDLKHVFLVFRLFDSGVNTYYKGVLASTLSLSTMVSRIFLVVLVRFISLALIAKRWLVPTRYISRKDVSGFILLKVFILLFCLFVLLETVGIDFSSPWGWL